MGIFSRLSDIVNSNINTILDRAEDPAKIVRLMIQEMEDTLVEVRSQAARIIADKKSISRRLGSLRGARDEWGRKAELALTKGREDLAKGALVEKARLGETAAAMAAELDRLDGGLGRHEDDIVKLETKLREARAKQKTIVARHETATSTLKVRRQLHSSRIEDAFTRFEQMERTVDRAESEAEVFELGGEPRTLSDEIADLESEEAVEAELKALKARLGRTRTAPKSPPKKATKPAAKKARK